ncbi:MAG TPA: galactose oxidase-like domain-containing protein [Gemmatimonadales bacterium]
MRLSYVCGNRFVLISSYTVPITVTWQVSGTGEAGSATLAAASPEHHPTSSERLIETRNRGPLELYQEGRRLKVRANGGIPCTPDAPAPAFAGTTSAQLGEWGPVTPWPLVAVHASLLSSGKVLVWGGASNGQPQLWDPATNGFVPYPSPALLFCSGHAFTRGGQLVVIGGHIRGDHGIPNITLWNNSSGWASSPPMPRGRWYPTATTLAGGEVLALGGADQQAVQVTVPEVWSSTGLRELTSASREVPYYPVSFLAPNGKVFVAGEQQMSRYLTVTGTGSWADVGLRRFGTRDQGSAVMYDEGRVLYAGGGRTTNTAETIDLHVAAPQWSWTGSMAYPRRHHNLTVLPTGEVLATGGTGGTEFNDLTRMVRAAEIWDPATGLWTTLASSSVDRGYHSVALLLPDGRVLQAGGGAAGGVAIDEMNAQLFSPPYLFRGARPRITAAPTAIAYGGAFTLTTPDAATIAKVTLVRAGSLTHGSDMNQRFQRLSFSQESGALLVSAPTSRNTAPPGHYLLFILDGNAVPSVAATVQLGSSSGPPPASFALTATGRADATTQYMSLTWSGASGAMVDVYRNAVLIRVTENDGKYTNSRSFTGTATYIYQVCQAGTTTCSNTATVQFGQPNVPPEASFSTSCSGLACSFVDHSSDPDGTVSAWSWNFGDGALGTVRNPTHSYGAGGTYTVTLSVRDNAGATGQVSSQVTVGTAAPIALSVTIRKDATTQYMTLTWSGASGAMVDVYRNGVVIKLTENDGKYTNTRAFTGPATYTYKVCQAGTAVCSGPVTVVFQ